MSDEPKCTYCGHRKPLPFDHYCLVCRKVQDHRSVENQKLLVGTLFLVSLTCLFLKAILWVHDILCTFN